MPAKTKKRSKKSVVPPGVGLWATIWWAVSCVYVLLLVWAATDNFAALSAGPGSQGFLSDWHSAIASAYRDSAFLQPLLMVIIAVWLIGGLIWLRELKRLKISYKAAFKDLFLTLR